MGSSGGRVGVGAVALLAFVACAGQSATPPPAQPYTSFEAVEVKVKSDPD